MSQHMESTTTGLMHFLHEICEKIQKCKILFTLIKAKSLSFVLNWERVIACSAAIPIIKATGKSFYGMQTHVTGT